MHNKENDSDSEGARAIYMKYTRAKPVLAFALSESESESHYLSDVSGPLEASPSSARARRCVIGAGRVGALRDRVPVSVPEPVPVSTSVTASPELGPQRQRCVGGVRLRVAAAESAGTVWQRSSVQLQLRDGKKKREKTEKARA